MKPGTMRRALIWFLPLLVAAATSAQEKKLQKSELPAAVKKAADEQSKGAVVKGYSTEIENGKRIYEVAMTVNGHGRDVSFDAAGNLLEVEEQVALDSLPAAVREGLLKQAGTGTIAKVESLSKQGKLVAYEAQVKTPEGKHREVQVGPDGKPLSHPQ